MVAPLYPIAREALTARDQNVGAAARNACQIGLRPANEDRFAIVRAGECFSAGVREERLPVFR